MMKLETDLWRHVVWSSTKSVCHSVQVDLEFAHSKVCQTDVAFMIQKDIVQLQVPENEKVFFIFLKNIRIALYIYLYV